VVFFKFVGYLWQVSGFLQVCRLLVAGQWFSSSLSVTCGGSVVFFKFVGYLWQVSGFLQVCRLLVAGQWFSAGTQVSSSPPLFPQIKE
jgi:hypothetical protein